MPERNGRSYKWLQNSSSKYGILAFYFPFYLKNLKETFLQQLVSVFVEMLRENIQLYANLYCSRVDPSSGPSAGSLSWNFIVWLQKRFELNGKITVVNSKLTSFHAECRWLLFFGSFVTFFMLKLVKLRSNCSTYDFGSQMLVIRDIEIISWKVRRTGFYSRVVSIIKRTSEVRASEFMIQTTSE